MVSVDVYNLKVNIADEATVNSYVTDNADLVREIRHDYRSDLPLIQIDCHA